MQSNRVLRAAVIAALVPAFVAGCAGSSISAISSVHAQSAPMAAAGSTASALRGLPDFSDLVTREGPAVVNISTTQKLTASLPQQQFDQNDPFFQFFRHFQIPTPQAAPSHAIGSGFIVTPDGYVLTNAHVVKGASEITVKLTDKREFKAKVVGMDAKSDVALLKIDATNLPAVRMGKPADVKVGQWVVAMGSPFGFDNSVTAGIVSAKSRELPDGGYVPFIQTDVAINPGNSGGPLFNLAGEVIGINSQIYSQTGGYMGLSFAIPIDVAMKVKNQLQKYGKVTHGRIGVAIQSVDQNLADSFGLKKPQGALVGTVEKGGPAERAGLKPGDIILSFNDKTIDSSSDLPLVVGETAPGQVAKLRIWREGAEHTMNVTVGVMPGETLASAATTGADSGKLGLQVRPLTKEEQEQLSVKGGLVVEQAAGAAARAGIQPDDVILGVNDEAVGSVQQLRHAIEKSGKHAALLVLRQDARIYVPVELG